MHPQKVGVARDEVCLILPNVVNQVSMWLPSSPSFNGRLQKTIKRDLHCPFPLPFLLNPRPPIYVRQDKSHSSLVGWSDTHMESFGKRKVVNMEIVDPYFID